ncbi:DnaA/Hda family protein [Tautonia sociabilis]|uniref:Chromosomal replication initiator protein DnaA n=1 Tax=Tautonia sociabilis TaxID=2080755 RepID=A0A432MQW3_9BACT|nr:DnaA/Hda family protein [Tautonia sociabilis]RUL89348.1 hypothetical protein TsocGM_02755 [Tautonia sociabilis]
MDPLPDVDLGPDPLANGPGPWDGFLVGPENAMAHAAACALARGTTGHSPLVIVGPAGSGKTRLLQELAADFIARRPESAVALLSGSSFAEECHRAKEAVAPDSWADLRRRLRLVDLLAIDDVLGLARSPIATTELASTLEDLEAAGASVVVTARDLASGWGDWPRRLADRFRGGLTVRLSAPGPATRRRFLLDRARALGLILSAEALDLLAESADGYRTLGGWLSRIALQSRVEGRPIDGELARTLVAEDAADGPEVSIGAVARSVARHFGLRSTALRSPSRRAAIVEARHLAILIARELTGASYARLGQAFGGRDAKTIRHACQAASTRLENDPAFAAAAAAIRREWRVDTPTDRP